MRDTTRDHTRLPEQATAGVRKTLSVGALLLPPAGRATRLVIHFHGSPWLPEWAVRRRFPQAAVLTVNLNGASDVYDQTFAGERRYEAVLREAGFARATLSSFSAGYGAVRAILRHRPNWARVEGVILADSLHAGYGTEAADLEPFVAYMREAARGRGQMLVTHSEVFPGTYASTTETADFLLQQLQVRRRALLKWGALGMQQLSEVRVGGFQMLGFAGNSAPDHADHLYALEAWLRLLR